MDSFLGRATPGSGRRYLWTDAYAVRNLLNLGRDEEAAGLIDDVHRTLGRHRSDDPRRGWISGLAEEEGGFRPTAGGLRIGKPLPERAASAPQDESLEWERDGQYFHYLTRWMTTLESAAEELGQPRYLDWAGELARLAHARFGHRREGAFRMFWKMSIDLTRPLVESMGHHDPLDGLVTALSLAHKGVPGLEPALKDYRSVVDAQDLATGDPLGMGGMLDCARRLADLSTEARLGDRLLRAADQGLRYYRGRTEAHEPAEGRLGFRELGLAIGLGLARSAGLRTEAPGGLEDAIIAYWSHPSHRSVRSWADHQDINDVMLATALLQV
jgi:hypothetical protein